VPYKSESSDYVAINSGLTIVLPDLEEMERITSLYQYYYGKDDFLEIRNRYLWVYKIMNQCVDEIEHRL